MPLLAKEAPVHNCPVKAWANTLASLAESASRARDRSIRWTGSTKTPLVLELPPFVEGRLKPHGRRVRRLIRSGASQVGREEPAEGLRRPVDQRPHVANSVLEHGGVEENPARLVGRVDGQGHGVV